MVHYRYIGMDVHRATISVAVADPDQAPVLYGTIPNTPAAVQLGLPQFGGHSG
jgi:hypothetical protein